MPANPDASESLWQSARPDGEKLIFHIDVNSAFLSWSAVKRLKEDPASQDLRLIPSAVGGDVETRHGIITAKSIPAKKYGIVTGEPVVKALQKCPELVLVQSDFTTYRAYSKAFINILFQYSDILEQVSIDEAYLDMTGTEDFLQAAKSIRDQIRESLGFTVNVGISSCKILAKMASDFKKPDLTHTLFPEEVPEKMWPLPIGELHGCGKATAERLQMVGIRSIGDAAATDVSLLQSLLGDKAGMAIHRHANGIGSAQVNSEREKAKSYSNETTTSVDISADNYESMGLPIIQHLSEKVAGRMQRDQVAGTTIFVNIKTSDFRRNSRQKSLRDPVNDAESIYNAAVELMSQLLLSEDGLFTKGDTLRLIGVGASGLDDGSFRQMNLTDWMVQKEDYDAKKRREREEEQARELRRRQEEALEQERLMKAQEKARLWKEKQERLSKMMDSIEGKYGKGSVKKASDIKPGDSDR